MCVCVRVHLYMCQFYSLSYGGTRTAYRKLKKKHMFECVVMSEMKRATALTSPVHTLTVRSAFFLFSLVCCSYALTHLRAAQLTEVNLSWRQFDHISASLSQIDMCHCCIDKYWYASCIGTQWNETCALIASFMITLSRKYLNGNSIENNVLFAFTLFLIT